MIVCLRFIRELIISACAPYDESCIQTCSFGKEQKFTVDFNSLWPRRFRSLFGISELSNEIEQFDVVVVNEVSNLRGEVGKFVAKFRTKFGH